MSLSLSLSLSLFKSVIDFPNMMDENQWEGQLLI